ncbi:hypothetical protein M422DRAFT_232799 [Sphaerobolus stellatus SS14]|uniref:Unplaced genomic scaffold SPHSTscaffold_294, whole genome shotgun sequence n=1 Tax=Sphaerobolus stellatus (strain SS14) TaxID=990650 RepID=A0A0C9TXC3_SPHS4|nr:hypothetical protein M422DRAFT_216305 [Sphaerobolus stellatus SS14]KIJ35732.1 hypothetical protein M422DRAFT_232799 [Sphaerobolus stellatus SS14]
MSSETPAKKRSRSPTDDTPEKQSKRPNTGAATGSDESAQFVEPSSAGRLNEVSMIDANSNAATNEIPSSEKAPASRTDGDIDVSGANASAAASSNASSPAVTAPPQLSSKVSSTSGNGSNIAAGSGSPNSSSAQIHMRCLIVTQDASIIIGKAGAHVNEIRQKSGARVMVSESIPGNPERILNVSGPLDAVSKAFGLIVRRINDEPFDVPSVPGSRAVTIKFMIPNSRMGSVIGKGGAKIKEIQDASGARLNASEGMLPGSTERVLSVAGVADAIHIATYYIGNILIEANERMPSTVNSSYRPSNRMARPPPMMGTPSGYPPYSNPYTYPHQPAHPHNPPQQLQTQQIYIPNDLVGCIIGKGGSKINEIRHMSASQIKIMEPGAVGVGMNGQGSENERLVVITGQPANIQMAVGLLYHRLEQEKQKQMLHVQNNGSASGSSGPMR